MDKKKVKQLITAIKKGHSQKLLNYINSGVNINVRTQSNEVPLHIAVRTDNLEIVRILLDNGADTEARNNDGQTPLELCSQFNGERKQAMEDLFKNHFQKQQTSDAATKTFIKRTGTAALGELNEVKLLTMVLFRLLHDHKVEDFYLGNNLDDAGAFDDVVLRTRVGGKSQVYFLQAKHKISSRTIHVQDTINAATGDFSLKKYFESFLKIRHLFSPSSKNVIFQGEYGKTYVELIIFTNAKFKFSDLASSDKTSKSDKFYSVQSGQTSQIKCTPDLVDSLSASHRNVVAEILAKLLTLHKYDKTNNLSEEIKKFEINKTLETYTNKSDNYNSSDLLKLYNNQEVMAVSGRNIQILSEKVSAILPDPFIPSDVEHTKLVEDFFDKVRFYTAQATEDQLEKIIISHIKAAKYEKYDLIYSKSYTSVENWWKQTGQVKFLTKSCTFFKATSNELKLEKLHVISMDKIKQCSAQFNENTMKNSGWAKYYHENQNGNIFFMHIVSSTPELSSMKLIQCFRESGVEYKFLIVDKFQVTLNVLMNAKLNCFILAYLTEADQETMKKFRETVNKLIIVTKPIYCENSNFPDETSLHDLEPQCQKKLLESTVLFQDTSIPLKSIIDGAPSTLVDPVTLQRLINGETLVVSKTGAPNEHDNSLRYYIDRILLDAKLLKHLPMDINDKVVLIAAAPGMGKSTLLTWLAVKLKRKNPSSWIVRINLLDCSAQFDQWTSTSLNNNLVIDFLMNHLNLQESDPTSNFESFERTVFRWNCEQQNIFFLFDGFDEISPDYTSKTIELIQICMNNFSNKLWVTTRFGAVQKKLEDNFGIEAFTLKSLVEGEARTYIFKVWTGNQEEFRFERRKIKDFIQNLLHQFPLSTHRDEYDLIGVPLQLNMIAEIFHNNFINILHKNNVQLKFTRVTLYEKFIKLKFDVLVKKCKTDATIPSNKQQIKENFKKINKNYRLVAICTLFNAEESKKILSEIDLREAKEFLEEIKHSVERTGIIVKIADGVAKFMHKTFEEFFAAQFLWEKYSTLDDRDLKFFVQEILINCLIFKGRVQILILLSELVQNNWKNCQNIYFRASVLLKEILPILSSSQQFDKESFSHVLCFVEYSIITEETEQLAKLLVADRRTLVPQASSYGADDAVKIIFDLSANVDLVGNDFYTPLHIAAQKNYPWIIKMLAGKVVNIDCTATDDGRTPLHQASMWGSIEAVKTLLEKGANVHQGTTNRGFTPLHFAAQENFPEIIKLLFEKKANIDCTTTDDGRTPLHQASMRGSIEAVKMLLDLGANVHQGTTDIGFTPLHIAAQKNFPEIIKLLFEKKANIDCTTTDNRRTPLHLASMWRSFEAVKMLLDLGANVHQETTDIGFTPLRFAALQNFPEIINLLVDAGANIDCTTTD